MVKQVETLPICALAAICFSLIAILPACQAMRMLRGEEDASHRQEAATTGTVSQWIQVGCESIQSVQVHKKSDGSCWVWAGEQATVAAAGSGTTHSSGTTQSGAGNQDQWVQVACTKQNQQFKKSDGSCWSWNGPPETPNQLLAGWEAFFFRTLGRPNAFPDHQPWPYTAEEVPLDAADVSTTTTP